MTSLCDQSVRAISASLLLLTLLMGLAPAAAAQDAATVQGATSAPAAGDAQPAAVTADLLDAKIAETESATDLPEETKNRLFSLYRRAQSNLQEAAADRASAQAFRQSLQSAPAEAEQVKDAAEVKRLDAEGASPLVVKLADQRKTLLEKSIDADDLLLRKLGELEAAQNELLGTIKRFNELLNVHLLWVRNASRTQLEALGALPEQVWRIVSPTGWHSVARVLSYQATHSAVFVLLAVALAGLLWGRRPLIRFIRSISDKLGKPTTDHFGYTLQALVVTLIAAAVWPLVAAVVGWQLQVSSQAADFSSAVGEALLVLALQFYFLRALRLICMPRGLAAAHFLWPEPSLRLLRIPPERDH